MAADIDKRLRYFNGQFLEEADFNDEQTYHLDRSRRHNRQLHTPGIADGLAIDVGVGSSQAVVHPGTALDEEGRLIVLSNDRTLLFDGFAGQDVLIVISYDEQASDPASAGTGSETRWHERPAVEVVLESAAPGPGTHIRLVRLTIGTDKVVSAEPDFSVQINAGGQLGDEVAVRKLSLRRKGVDPSLWPDLSSGAPSRLDVGGDLTVTGAGSIGGNLSVGGQVDGRDVAADGAALDAHLAQQTGNPHKVSAADIGALLASDYDFAQNAPGFASFSHGHVNGSTMSMSFGFPPRLIWINGGTKVLLGGAHFGGMITGFVNLTAGISLGTYQRCQRNTNVPYIEIVSWGDTSKVFSSLYRDWTTSPIAGEYLYIDLSLAAGDPTTVVLTLTRELILTTYAPLPYFYINMNLFCFG